MDNVLNGLGRQPATVAVPASGQVSIDALMGDTRWVVPTDGPLVLTYSFPYANGINPQFEAGSGYSNLLEPQASFGLDAAQRQGVRDALSYWSGVANIDFQEVTETNTSAGTLRFAWTNRSNGPAVAWAYGPHDSRAAGGDVWLGAGTSLGLLADDAWHPGGEGYATLLHEIGHALGLKHPFDGAPQLGEEDSQQYTVMSYTEHPHGLFLDVTQTSTPTGTLFSAVLKRIEPDTAMIYDISAIQYLYGARHTSSTSDDVYSFNPEVPFLRTLWDAGGSDTISVAPFSRGVKIDLNPGSFSSITVPSDALPNGFPSPPQATYDGTDNLAIAFGTIIENVIGGSAADIIIGNASNNRLQGGGGNDSLAGGTGIDWAIYTSSRASTSLAIGTDAVAVSNPEGSDILVGIERLEFSDRKVALDLSPTGNAGQAALMLGVLLPASIAQSPPVVGLAIGLVDSGLSLPELSQWVVDNGILAQLAGSNEPVDIARLAVLNVLKTGDAQLVDLALSFMDGRQSDLTPAGFLAFVADLELNRVAIGLAGLQQTGLDFL